MREVITRENQVEAWYCVWFSVLQEKILSEQRDFHISPKENDQAFRREYAAQTMLSEALSVLDRQKWKLQNSDRALCESSIQLQSQGEHFITRIN